MKNELKQLYESYDESYFDKDGYLIRAKLVCRECADCPYFKEDECVGGRDGHEEEFCML